MVKVFIDSSGWKAIANPESENHEKAREYFQNLLDSGTKIYTNILEVNDATNQLKKDCGPGLAQDFSKIIDEAILRTNINMIWLTRRLRRNSLKQFFSMGETQIELNHCIIFEEIQRKKINVIFSFDDSLKIFGIPLMPHV